jgi:RNA polymerase sigma-70 factor (ECF subfamily)
MTPEQDSRTPFLPTRWSLVHRVQAGGDEAFRALGELCQAYWFPLYGWARRSGSPPADAEDLVQGFFSDVVRKRLFERADEEKGRLRTFLLTAFRRYSRDMYVKATAQQRGGDHVISFDAMAGEESYLAEGSSAATPDAFYDRQWALTVLGLAIGRLEAEYTKRGKADDFERLRPYLTEAGDADYEQDAEALGMTSGAVRVAVHRLRDRFREALREEVASMQDETEDVDEELAHLLRALEA